MLDLMLDAKVQAKLKPLNTAVKFVTTVSCANVEKELLMLTVKESAQVKGNPNLKLEEWSLVKSKYAATLTLYMQ